MLLKSILVSLAAICFACTRMRAAEPVPLLETSELRGFADLSEGRRNLIELAVEAGKEVAGMPYLYGGNGREDGGFDCSGAMYYVLRKAGLKPPRTSSDQFLWVKKARSYTSFPSTLRIRTTKVSPISSPATSSSGPMRVRPRPARFGLCDFRLPSNISKGRMEGYGTPPGLAADP